MEITLKELAQFTQISSAINRQLGFNCREYNTFLKLMDDVIIVDCGMKVHCDVKIHCMFSSIFDNIVLNVTGYYFPSDYDLMIEIFNNKLWIPFYQLLSEIYTKRHLQNDFNKTIELRCFKYGPFYIHNQDSGLEIQTPADYIIFIPREKYINFISPPSI